MDEFPLSTSLLDLGVNCTYPAANTLTGFLIAVALAAYLLRHQSHGTSANCGSPSQFGYSCEPESKPEDIVKLCATCLAAKLKDDYQSYEGRALDIPPAPGFPCYVFQMNSKRADSRLTKEVNEVVSEILGLEPHRLHV